MLLARPIKRSTLVATVALAVASMLLLVLFAVVVGILAGSSVEGLSDQVPVRELLIVWAWSALLYGAFASFALAASATSNRTGPAVSWTLGFLIVNYFFEIDYAARRHPERMKKWGWSVKGPYPCWCQ